MINSGKAQYAPGSPYTFFALGDIQIRGGGYQLMKGGTGLADRNSLSINTLNPASYSTIAFPNTFISEFGISIGSVNWDDGDNSDLKTEADFPFLNFAFKTGERGGTAVGLRRFSYVNYDITGIEQFNGLPGEYQVRYEGSGGLNEVFVGYGWRVNERLSLGAQLSYIFGTINHDQRINSQSINYNVLIENRQFSNGARFSLGTQYLIPIGESSISLGINYEPQTQLFNSQELTITDLALSELNDTIAAEELSVNDDILPHSIGLGMKWNIRNKFALSADAATQFWSQSELDGNDYEIRDSRRISLGFEKLPNFSAIRYKKWIGWAVGIFANQSYLSLDNQGLDTYGVTAGISIPSKGNRGRIRIIGEYGTRGQDLSAYFSEQYAKLTLNFSFTELWFNKQKLD